MKRKLNQSILMAIVMTMLFPLAAAAEAVGYAVFNSADNTLTFKYGEKPDAGTDVETVYDLNEGGNLPGWFYLPDNPITKVVFDESFKDARPTTCAGWFYCCKNLTNIEGIENFNTSEVTNMTRMFCNCSKLFYLDLTNFDTSKVIWMDEMFYGCSNLITIYASDTFVFDKLIYGKDMFSGCTSLVGAISYDEGKTDKTYANYETGYFTKSYPAVGEGVAYAINNSPYETLIFKYGETVPDGAKAIDINSGNSAGWGRGHDDVQRIVFDPSFKNARPTTCKNLFYNLYNLTDIIGIENLNTSEVTDMSFMFCECSSLTSLDLSNFDTSKVTDMSFMFFECSELTSLDLSNFDTSNVTNMCAMFFECKHLTSLDLSNFDTSNVTDMCEMFNNCLTLTSLDLSNFDTSNVTEIYSMFQDCSALTTIYVSDKFTTDNANDSMAMFSGCSSLVGAAECDGTNGVDGTGANYITGYFKTYYTEDGVKKELCGTDNYDTQNNAFKIEKVSFDDNDVIDNVPLSVTGNITYTRQLDDEWETLCLPYGMTYDNANGTYKLYSLASADANELTFIEYANGANIAAGTPMLIQRQGSEACQANLTSAGGIVNCNIEAPESTEWRLVGTLSESAVPEEAYVLNEGAFHKASALAQETDIVTEAPYRAYVMPAAEATAADVLNINVAANVTTSIHSITDVFSPAATYYDLSGRRLPSLRQGTNIVIIGNKTKKVVIK